MRRILCVRLLSWPIDRTRRRRPALRDKPLVLVAEGRRTIVVAACAMARANGVTEGMTLAEASALCAGLVYLPHDAQQDDRSLEDLARWLMPRFDHLNGVSISLDILIQCAASVNYRSGC